MIFRNRKKIGLLFILSVLVCLFCCGQRPAGGLLFDFESEDDLAGLFWRCRTWVQISSENAPVGDGWLKAELQPGQYPGIRFQGFPPDWSGYGGLSFKAEVPEKHGQNLYVRIDDKESGPGYNDRFNMIFELKQGAKRYCAPFGKNPPIRLGKIKLLMIYLYKQETPSVLFIDDIRLVKNCTGN